MKWFQFFKQIFRIQTQEASIAPDALETLLDAGRTKGDVYGVLRILDKLNRPFGVTDRLALMHGCLENKKFCEAFYLVRDLPTNIEKKNFLDRLSKQAAFGDDYSTARSAALLSERMIL